MDALIVGLTALIFFALGRYTGDDVFKETHVHIHNYHRAPLYDSEFLEELLDIID